MYIRFVVHQIDRDSGRRQGLFQALSDLEHAGALLPHEQAVWFEILQWFRENLKKPESFSRSKKPHAKNVALSWFKGSADEHVAKMYSLVQILVAHDVVVDVVRTLNPGYVVYEDVHQVVAEPFGSTRT